jgi:uncharacterized membrane-anchored protein YhcB (DUF1043 family)
VLLDRFKVSPNLPVSYDTTLAELAALYDHPALGKILSLAVPQDIQISGSILTRVSGHQNPQTLKNLMAHGIDMSKTDELQRTVLHTVRSAELIPDLIRSGLNLEAIDADGSSPLAQQVRSANTACVEALLAAGANPLAKDARDRTPRDIVSSNAHKFLSDQESIRLENILVTAEDTWIENQRIAAAAARKAAIEEMVGRAAETQQPVPRLRKMQLGNRKPAS